MSKNKNAKRFAFRLLDIVSNFDIRYSNFIFFLILLFLPTQLGKHFWPSWSQVLGLRIDYLSPTLYFTDILIILLFSVVVAKYFKSTYFVNPKHKIRSSKQFRKFEFSKLDIVSNFDIRYSNLYFAGIWLTAIVIGIVFSKNPMAGWYGLIKLIEFIFFGWYTAKHVKNISAISVSLSIGVAFESLLAIAQVITQGSVGSIFYWLGERTFFSQTPGIANASLNGALFLRPYATFSHPNVLAGFLTIAMAIVISKIKYEKSKMRKPIYALAVLIGTLALFLTLSRVAIVVWITILIVTFLIGIKEARGQKALIAIFIIATAIVLFFTPLPSRFLQTSFMDESLQLRILLSQSALLMVREHPLFGVGVYNFISSLPSYQHTRAISLFSMFQPVHNIFLLIASETGLISLGLFLWFIRITYARLKLFPRSWIQLRWTILTIVLILGMFDHYLLTLQQGQLLFALVFGLCWSRRDTIGKDS